MWKRETCHFCHLTIAIGEAREKVGNYYFHRDETKRCFQKYAATRQTQKRPLESSEIATPPASRFDRR